jgi:hypothetical protein
MTAPTSPPRPADRIRRAARLTALVESPKQAHTPSRPVGQREYGCTRSHEERSEC